MWKKTTNTYQADISKFEVRASSLGQLAKWGFIGGLIWGLLFGKF